MTDNENEEMDNLLEALTIKAKQIAADSGLDAIQIMASYIDEKGNTFTVRAGHGNHHARMDMAREWIIMQDERSKIMIRQEEDE